MLNGLTGDAAEFEEAKSWSHSLDSDEWTHLQKSTQNVNQLLEKVEENVGKSFEEMENRISEIGKHRNNNQEKYFDTNNKLPKQLVRMPAVRT